MHQKVKYNIGLPKIRWIVAFIKTWQFINYLIGGVMKKSTFSESQFVKILKEIEDGRRVHKVARELGVAKTTF